jgi:SAM-dependent methyltransferase
MQYNDMIDSLRHYYNQDAERRDQQTKATWKQEERHQFLTYLQGANARRLLEIGAGTGQDSLFFHNQGFDVVCTDLSPTMVARCQDKGLMAYVMDFLHLDFPPASFDAVYSCNCLLHVSKADLPRVLAQIHALLQPRGLFYYGVYGGVDKEGVFSDGSQDGSRFFSYYQNDQLPEVVKPYFEPLSYNIIPLDGGDREYYQSLVLQKRNHSIVP